MPDYSSFPNRETWIVNNAILNDATTYRKLRDVCLNKSQDSAIKELRKYFQHTLECAGCDPSSNLFADVFVSEAFNSFLGRVHWDSIYSHLVKKAELEFMQ